MVNAGRILILPKGAWDNLTSYDMLDLVTASDNIAYLARQASVGVNPVSDTTHVYWQPFGSTVTVDGQTIIQDANGIISVPIDNSTIQYDSTNNVLKAEKALGDLTNVNLRSLSEGQALVYDATANEWKNANISTTFAGLTDTDVTSATNGQIPMYNSTSTKWEKHTLAKSDVGLGNVPNVTTDNQTPTFTQASTRANIASGETLSTLFGKIMKWFSDLTGVLKVTSKQVATTGWTADTTSQSGTTLYKKTIALSHVYVTSPIVDIGASGVLPTTAQQEAYDLLQYVTINGTTLTLYSSAIPSTSYYINITGVD